MHLSTKVVGARHRGEDDLKAAMAAVEGDYFTLVREPNNRFDANAIQVHYEIDFGAEKREFFIGYIPKSDNADLAAALDVGRTFTCLCSGHAQYYEPTVDIDEVDQSQTPQVP